MHFLWEDMLGMDRVMQDLTFDAPVIKMAYHPTSVYQNAYSY